jgi:hypothetical protein
VIQSNIQKRAVITALCMDADASRFHFTALMLDSQQVEMIDPSEALFLL